VAASRNRQRPSPDCQPDPPGGSNINVMGMNDTLLGADRGSGLKFVANFTAKRPTLTERFAAGKILRKTVPRSSHALYRPPPDRPDPVSVIEAQNASRIPALVPVRMGRMAASPFAFLRGSAAIMAADLATATPATGLDVMACGDMHLANFGMFGSAERNLIFAINDFDEVHPGPWEWDLKRLAASAAVAAMFLGGDRVEAAAAAHSMVRAYRRRIQSYAEMPFLQVWYDLIDERRVMDAAPEHLRGYARTIIDRAHARGPLRTLDRLTEEVDGARRIVEDVPLIVRETHLSDGMPVAHALDSTLQAYVQSLPPERKILLSHYRIVDVARKVVGVGSVGMSCWVILLDGLGADDPLFLQVKEVRQSVLTAYVKTQHTFTSHGQRVVIGQRMIQGSPDIFLGWGPNHAGNEQSSFYVRQLADMKGGMRFAEGDRATLDSLDSYCALCGWALALAHAKSGDPAMIAGYCGNSDALPDAISDFALAYLDQTLRDHATLMQAIRTGRLPALVL
jgi:uncharacterized protein (DUF2252 family)